MHRSTSPTTPLLRAGLLLIALCTAGCGTSDPAPNAEPEADSAQEALDERVLTETGYIAVSDGTRLRYHMQRLEGAPPGPVVMQYDGYDAGTGGYFSDIPEVKAALMRKGYSILGVSVRGTGCSSGGFDLFDPQRAIDGAEAVEWAAVQPWSDGNIGMIGYSYPGIMQLFVAGQKPPHLKAIAPANVIFDLYRDVGAPGGILNGAFTALFTVQQQAPGALGLPDAIAQADPECITNYLANRLAYQSFIVDGIQSPHIDGTFGWMERSPAATAAQIDVPVLTINFWQDEQTGSRIGGLLEPGGLLNVLGLEQSWTVMSNGNHDLTWGHPLYAEMLVSFYEHYLRGVDNGWPTTPRVQILHELDASTLQPNWITTFDEFPEPRPTALYLHANGHLANDAPSTLEASDSYIYPLPSTATNPLPDSVDILDQLWRLPAPDQGRVVFTTPVLQEDLQLLGSASLDLWLASTAQDTDIQATLTEVRPDGQEVYVARGWLRASKRALDASRSTPTRPFQQHTEDSVAMLTPGEPSFMRLEIFPFAHRFRAGSALRLIIDGPVATTGDWGAFLNPTPSINRVLHDLAHPSRLVIGVMDDDEPRPEARACGALANQPCRSSIAHVPSGSIAIGN
ncbi:CocE/NonD family hydrolase [Algiphilus sp.]|uniref:CocE/NonD family hydrolase n=1 Tax=Algiphilus sp. TaxID=1872431 RepID=UPI003B51E0A1